MIEYVTDYLTDDESLRLLSEADLIVNPYQESGESASASVRHGLSSGRPVAVTPLMIFNDIKEAVFQMSGISPDQMAHSIDFILEQVECQSEFALAVASSATNWVDDHDYHVVGPRHWRLAEMLVKHPFSSKA